MKIGVTVRFRNSYFSGSGPQIACALARAFQLGGHDVTLLYPKDEQSWFADCASYGNCLPDRKVWSNDQTYDVILEVVWMLSQEDRAQCAKRVIYFVHSPPIFSDTESCVYSWNPTVRNFKGLHGIWTYDHYSRDDVAYLECLARVPVTQVPFVWDPDAIDMYVKENNIPTWGESAKQMESLIPADKPPTLSWCARIVESNFSNTSHCIIPLNIVSYLRTHGTPIRFSVHNGEMTAKSEFFKSNIVQNLMLPDISGNMVPRIRLPDLRREKSVIVAHQRFRPLKSFLLDATYLGIPLIHNSAIMKTMGAPYYYELNQIQQAAASWKTMEQDYANKTGFFQPKASEVRQRMLRARFSPAALAETFSTHVERPAGPLAAVIPIRTTGDVLRVGFADMWDQFQPKYNFFMYLLSWVGHLNNIKVVHDDATPDVVFFGPLSKGTEAKYHNIPKVYFTGENAPANKDPSTILNIGFSYEPQPSYIRLPLWVTEINWWGADVNKVVNPRYVELKDCMTVPDSLLDSKRKFCGFVATNPSNNNRNAAFQILNQWRHVDSGGRLFCNLPGGPIPAGLGGGGGELAKIEFFKDYKFALTYENSSAPGYTTEKLFHAKVAGCVPIYWGDPFVDRDFESRGFINANQAATPNDLITMVKNVADNEAKWREMASVPALSEFKKKWCERTMAQIAKAIFKKINGRDVEVADSAWETAHTFGALYESPAAPTPMSAPVSAAPAPVPAAALASATLARSDSSPTLVVQGKRVLVTAATPEYIESAMNLFESMRKSKMPADEMIAYVWPTVSDEHIAYLKEHGASEIRKFPTDSFVPWADFWDPQHFGWKLWLHVDALKHANENDVILYLDAGVMIASSPETMWSTVAKEGIFLLNDHTQTNERWCHDACCEKLQITESEKKGHQITAGLIGYKKGHACNAVFDQALQIAQTHRDALVGKKWHMYSSTCMGHRHDQSILSVLTQRAGYVRQPLSNYYCDESLRSTRRRGVPLYVHRGKFRDLVPFADNIDEAFVINLERRADRLETFNNAHAYMKDRVNVWKAADGRALTLTPELVFLFRENDFKWKKSVMGCALSHYGLWEKCATDGVANNYLILEDDVRFDKQWLLQWANASKDVPADADVIYLGGVLPPNKAAFPAVIEPVNAHFARVAKNTLFGSEPRRYFHFCNYAYILTKKGAQKLVQLVKQRGIFTSGDHMIVNHGDNLLNIYFTTPLMASCFQENDPVYQKSEFNNFNRVDNFDSDLWNNTDCFAPEEIMRIVEKIRAAAPAPAPAAAPPAADATVMWNTFLRQIALKQTAELEPTLDAIFAKWKSMNHAEFEKQISWFRMFEQLILTQNEIVLAHKQKILMLIKSSSFGGGPIWDKITQMLEDRGTLAQAEPNVVFIQRPEPKHVVVYHMKEIDPTKLYETQWLDAVFPHPIEFKPLNVIGDLLACEHPVFLYQKYGGGDVDVSRFVNLLLNIMRDNNKKMTVIHISDEFASDDISFYKHPALKHVIRNYWRPDLATYGSTVVLIPLGPANGRHAAHLTDAPSFSERRNVWAFAGSADRQGRPEGLAHLRTAGPFEERTKNTWSAPPLADGPTYNTMIRNAKFAPCFRGSAALESFRIYEALEHGAIPIYVPAESHKCADELKEMYGKHPFLGFASWEQAAAILPKLVAQPDVMEKHRRSLQEWWAQKKAEIANKLKEIL